MHEMSLRCERFSPGRKSPELGENVFSMNDCGRDWYESFSPGRKSPELGEKLYF